MVFAAGLLVDAVEDMQSLGWLPVLTRPLWNTNRVLNEGSTFGDIVHTFFGYVGRPTGLELAVWVGYVLVAVTGLPRVCGTGADLRWRPAQEGTRPDRARPVGNARPTGPGPPVTLARGPCSAGGAGRGGGGGQRLWDLALDDRTAPGRPGPRSRRDGYPSKISKMVCAAEAQREIADAIGLEGGGADAHLGRAPLLVSLHLPRRLLHPVGAGAVELVRDRRLLPLPGSTLGNAGVHPQSRPRRRSAPGTARWWCARTGRCSIVDITGLPAQFGVPPTERVRRGGHRRRRHPRLLGRGLTRRPGAGGLSPSCRR